MFTCINHLLFCTFILYCSKIKGGMGVSERAPHSLGGKQQVPTGWWPCSCWWVRSRSCRRPALSSLAPLPPPPPWREWAPSGRSRSRHRHASPWGRFWQPPSPHVPCFTAVRPEHTATKGLTSAGARVRPLQRTQGLSPWGPGSGCPGPRPPDHVAGTPWAWFGACSVHPRLPRWR